MEVIDLSHKLAYAGTHSPVPFLTGPEYTNSVPGVPVLATLRIFVEPQNWSEENILTIAREIARILGPTEQYDIGITHTTTVYAPDVPAAGNTARIMKMDRESPEIRLLASDGNGDRAFMARYPRLRFEPMEEQFWEGVYVTGAVKVASQP
jgi:hypothetical protein